MLINQIATFLSNKSVLYLFSVIDNLRFNFGGKFKFIDFREKSTFNETYPKTPFHPAEWVLGLFFMVQWQPI